AVQAPERLVHGEDWGHHQGEGPGRCWSAGFVEHASSPGDPVYRQTTYRKAGAAAPIRVSSPWPKGAALSDAISSRYLLWLLREPGPGKDFPGTSGDERTRSGDDTASSARAPRLGSVAWHGAGARGSG